MPAKNLFASSLLCCVCLLPLSSTANDVQPERDSQSAVQALKFTPAQLKADLQSLRAHIDAIHPDISHSASPAQLEQAYAEIAASLTEALTAKEFWLRMARLNPLFNDGHWSVNLPETEHDLQKFIDNIGGGFPFEVHVKPDGELTVLALAGGGATAWRGARIEAINGVVAPLLSRQLLALRHGDTPMNRANLLGPSFQLYYASLFGSPAEFTLRLKQNDKLTELTLPASKQAARLGRDTGKEIADFFSYQALDAQTAYLKLGSFSLPDEPAVGVFTKQAFTQMKASGATRLIIDVRENRGGNDSVWLEHVMPYLADQPFRAGSHSKKKVIASRATPAEPAGQVIDGQINTWHQPQLANPLRFKGKVVLLIGRRTYSSAVQFANVMQDFGFATLAGEAAYVRSRSTGGIQYVTLPHSKLFIVIPRFWVARPQGGFSEQLLSPDWLMQDDVSAPDSLVQAVVRRMQQQSKL
ncbi:S41 family peptidase [Massilia sp. W12]|uniref:S41 family peptidase n=1 Tax=Massilia sp. W12 TaxID=3126507 RepID=UPI0030CE7168